MNSEKNKKIVRMLITVIIIIVIVWFLVVNPLVKFKKMENQLLNSAKRYFEVNQNLLPTGSRIRKISLQTLYDKDYIMDDLKSPYNNSLCNPDDSWVKVIKNKDEYKYSAYLECGIFKSKIDHKGPTIKLNGEDEITIYNGDEYKELGVESVYDDTDGKIDVSKVKIDSSKVNTSKNGKYEVVYEISDSLENKTIKKRIVNVTQTLNNLVIKNTDKSGIYKGLNTSNYLKIDGILFKIVGINKDDSVKVVSDEVLATLDYNNADDWLNNYFYEKLSDNAKEYIVKSKWCNETIKDISNYTKCNGYTKNQYVGLLSVLDYNNSKDDNNVYNLSDDVKVWTYNKKDDKNSWMSSYYDSDSDTRTDIYKDLDSKTIIGIKPALNIKKDATIVKGSGTNTNPYILKGNNNKLKAGSKISNVVTGSYIEYSGYNFRVISKEEDGSVKVIMNDSLKTIDEDFYSNFDTELNLYNPNRKTNIGYVISNKISQYIKTDYFDTKNIEVKKYGKDVLYGKGKSANKYKVKLSLASMFDLYSANRVDGVSTWYIETSDTSNYINSATFGLASIKFDATEEKGVKLTAYINKNIVIKAGEGSKDNPYTLTK